MPQVELDIFQEVALILALAAVVGIVATRLRQPLIIAYIIVGVLVGPAAFGIVSVTAQIEIFAGLGIAVLLFVVGLKLDLRLIQSVGPVALATGIGQITITSIAGFAIAMALGFSAIEAGYIAVALTFSSTIVVVKLLSDKREIDSLHGRIAVGFLIVQDIFVVLVLVLLPAFAAPSELALADQMLRLGVFAAALVGGIAIFMKWIAEPLLKVLARSQEMLVLFAVMWAVSLGALGDFFGFSKEVGAFLGGVSLASTPYREAIVARLTGLRDFLLLFFFVDLGSKLNIADFGDQLVPALVLSAFVLIGNPLIVVGIMGRMGYRRRTGMFAGLTVAQISEFSLILAAMGVALGHLGTDVLSLITMVGIMTISISVYMILGADRLYDYVQRPLKIFERPVPFREIEDSLAEPARVDVIVLGLGRYGGTIVDGLKAKGLTVLGVDFDPQALRGAKARGIPIQYGDAEDPEFTGSLPLSSADVVVSTVPSLDINKAIVHGLQAARFKGRFVATAHDESEIELLKAAGAYHVLMPFMDAAEQAVETVASDVCPEVGVARA